MTAEELAVEIERQAACDGACDDCVALRAAAARLRALVAAARAVVAVWDSDGDVDNVDEVSAASAAEAALRMALGRGE